MCNKISNDITSKDITHKYSKESTNTLVRLAVEEALMEHKKKNVPYVILDKGIIYEVYSDGHRAIIK